VQKISETVNGTTVYNGLFRIAPFDAYMFNKFTLSLKPTEKEVAQLILNKDEKCIRQEILRFLTDDEIVADVKPSEKCNGSCN
jgi:hypothetical protein